MKHGPCSFLLVVLLVTASVADYIPARDAAVSLMKSGKHEAALTALVQLAEGKISNAQKADALELAAMCAQQLKQYDRAVQLAEQIPLEPQAKVVQMRLMMMENGKPDELLRRFGSEDFTHWPKALAGEAFFHRGRAHVVLKQPTDAEADLTRAVALMGEGAHRGEAALALANHYRDNTKDLPKALAAYQRLQDIESKRDRGGWLYLTGITSAAAVLIEQRKLDDADAMLQRVDSEKLNDTWRLTFRAARAEVLAARGDTSKAIAIYEEVMKSPEIREWQKAQFAQRLEQLRAAR